MKKVKINFVGCDEKFNKQDNLIYTVLTANGYDVEISDEPDYIVCICDYWEDTPYEYCKYPQVRIMHSGENYIPDFNLIDYAISPYPIQFGDRNFYLPTCVCPGEHWHALPGKNRDYPDAALKDKIYFANFIAGHESEGNIRGDVFKMLCQYKRVESPGSYLNNMPGGAVVDWLDGSKSEFQRKCKFTLCFESTLHYGFVTEKIMDAFYADTIPVYYGSPTVTDIFNKNAFINCTDYPSFDAVIEKIKELDQDDEKYLQMLRQPILVNPDYPRELEEALGKYICSIFDQPLETAYRRSRVYLPQRCNDFLVRAVDSDTLTLGNLTKRILNKIRNKVFNQISEKQK